MMSLALLRGSIYIQPPGNSQLIHGPGRSQQRKEMAPVADPVKAKGSGMYGNLLLGMGVVPRAVEDELLGDVLCLAQGWLGSLDSGVVAQALDGRG